MTLKPRSKAVERVVRIELGVVEVEVVVVTVVVVLVCSAMEIPGVKVTSWTVVGGETSVIVCLSTESDVLIGEDREVSSVNDAVVLVSERASESVVSVDVAFSSPTVVHEAVFHLYVFSGTGGSVGHGSVWQLWLYSGLPAGWQR